jgi:hypothetical protein
MIGTHQTRGLTVYPSFLEKAFAFYRQSHRMHPERAPILDETFTDASERGEIANDNGPEQKRTPELRPDTSNEGESVGGNETVLDSEKEPTFEDAARAIAIEKHGGRAEEWKPNTDFAEWNKNYVREDGEIVDHRGIPVMESAMKDPKGTDSVEFKRFLEVQQHLKNKANIGVPIYSGDYTCVVDGKEIYQVTSAVRRENGEIEYLSLENIKELTEEDDDDDDEDDTVIENAEEGSVAEQGIGTPFVTVEDDGSILIDLTAALEATLDEIIEDGIQEEKDEKIFFSQRVAASAETLVVDEKISIQKISEVITDAIKDEIQFFKPLGVAAPTQKISFAKTVGQVPEAGSKLAEPRKFLTEPELETKKAEEVFVAQEKPKPVLETIVAPLKKEITAIPATTFEKAQTTPKAVVEQDVYHAASAETPIITKPEPSIATPISAEVELKEIRNETIPSDAPAVSFQSLKPVLAEPQEKVRSEEQQANKIALVSTQKKETGKEREQTTEEKDFAVNPKIPKAIERVEQKEIVEKERESESDVSVRGIERTVAFVPALSADESSARSKESPFVVYENELKLRQSTESPVAVQGSERPRIGIPDGSMSPANAVVAANDNAEEARKPVPGVVGIAENGITLNFRDAA